MEDHTMSVYIIVGAGQTRKSSTIRALTGVGRTKVVSVRLAGGQDMNVLVRVQSLQEEGIEPERFVQFVQGVDPHVENILLPLRVGNNHLPNAGAYINTFLLHHWHIADVVVLGQQDLPLGLDQIQRDFGDPLAVPNVEDLPVNEIAHSLRDRWGWR
jgi:hypothetical protein